MLAGRPTSPSISRLLRPAMVRMPVPDELTCQSRQDGGGVELKARDVWRWVEHEI